MSYKLAMTMPENIGITAVVASLPDSASMDCVLGKKAAGGFNCQWYQRRVE